MYHGLNSLATCIAILLDSILKSLTKCIPLRPEEANDCKLAAFLDDHDFSFLFESTAQENRQDNSSFFRKLADSLYLIEVAAKYQSTETLGQGKASLALQFSFRNPSSRPTRPGSSPGLAFVILLSNGKNPLHIGSHVILLLYQLEMPAM
jgi:hypothetical protein